MDPFLIQPRPFSILLRMCPSISQGLFSILDGMYFFTPLDYVKSGNDLEFVCHYVVTTGAHSVVALDEVVLLFLYFRRYSRSLRCLLGIGPRMRCDSDSTISNRVTRPGRRNALSPIYNQRFRYTLRLPFTVLTRPCRRFMKRDRETRSSQREKHFT